MGIITLNEYRKRMESLSDEELLHEIDIATVYNKEWETHNNKLSKEVDELIALEKETYRYYEKKY